MCRGNGGHGSRVESSRWLLAIAIGAHQSDGPRRSPFLAQCGQSGITSSFSLDNAFLKRRSSNQLVLRRMCDMGSGPFRAVPGRLQAPLEQGFASARPIRSTLPLPLSDLASLQQGICWQPRTSSLGRCVASELQINEACRILHATRIPCLFMNHSSRGPSLSSLTWTPIHLYWFSSLLAG